MNLFVIFGIVAVLFVLGRLRVPTLAWIFLWPLAVWATMRFGISPPAPSSVVNLYLSLTMVGVLAYLYADDQRYDEVASQIYRFITEKRYQKPLAAVVVLLPLLLAANIYADMTREPRAPTFGRTVHPAPPNMIMFKGKEIDLIRGRNPYRELETTDPAKFREHVEEGRTVYYQNCVFCHGDDMYGDGIFAHAFFPVPANFHSPSTIAMLQESYLFWRIAKGAPGLPEESGPWESSMPAWELFLEEEDIWNVILFLYDYTGLKPRAEEDH